MNNLKKSMLTKNQEITLKVIDLLTNNSYISAKELSTKCHVKTWRIYQIIRDLRRAGTGIHPLKKGYVLSEFANKNDDIGLIRWFQGRRVSDLTTLLAAKPHILNRWKAVNEQRDVSLMLESMLVQQNELNHGKKLIQIYEKKLKGTLKNK